MVRLRQAWQNGISRRSARVAAAPRGGQCPRTECPARRRPLRRRRDVDPVTRLRALIGRFLPEGALVLSVLTFGYFVMGQRPEPVLRERHSGSDVELDIVLRRLQDPGGRPRRPRGGRADRAVRPDLQRLRREDEEAANDFGRTVQSVAVLVMAAAMAGPHSLFAPRDVDLVARGVSTPQAGSSTSRCFRIMCLTPVIFAASITIGEVLVANRRFVVLRPRTDPLHRRDRPLHVPVRRRQPRDPRTGARRRRWRARPPRDPHRRTESHDLSGSGRSCTFGRRPSVEFIRLMLPRMVSHPIEPLILSRSSRVLALDSRGGQRLVARTSPPITRSCRSASSASSFSLAVFPTLSAAYTRRRSSDVPIRPPPERRDDRAPDDARGHRPCHRRSAVRSTSCSVAASSGPTTSPDGGGLLAAFALSIPFDSLSTRSRGRCTRPTTRCSRSSPRSAAFGTIVVVASGPRAGDRDRRDSARLCGRERRQGRRC